MIDDILVQCAESGSRRARIYENIYIHTLVRKTPYYQNQDNYRININRFYPSFNLNIFLVGERPHYCSLCNKGFQTSSDLKRHKRTRVHQERVEQAGGIDPIDTAVPQTGTGNNAATQGGVGAPATGVIKGWSDTCLLYTSPSPRD